MFAYMKHFILMVLMLTLTSCWPEYRQLDKDNNPVKTDIIYFHNCKIVPTLTKKVYGDHIADYHVDVEIMDINTDMQLKSDNIIVNLSQEKSGNPYKPYQIKFQRLSNAGETFIPWDPANAPEVTPSQILELKKGYRYSLIYSFTGSHHNLIRLSISANINGEKVNRGLLFKKHTEVELLH